MCGRYVIEEDESVDLAELYAMIGERHPEIEMKRGEIFPTDTVPLISAQGGRLVAFPGVWGYPVGGKGRPLINARSETVEQRPAFAQSFRTMRCVIPTSGYYEWSADRVKHRMNLPGRRMLFLAGLYCRSEEGVRFAILTTAPSQTVGQIHHRMPLILPSGALLSWSQDLEFARRYLKTAMPELTVLPCS